MNLRKDHYPSLAIAIHPSGASDRASARLSLYAARFFVPGCDERERVGGACLCPLVNEPSHFQCGRLGCFRGTGVGRLGSARNPLRMGPPCRGGRARGSSCIAFPARFARCVRCTALLAKGSYGLLGRLLRAPDRAI